MLNFIPVFANLLVTLLQCEAGSAASADGKRQLRTVTLHLSC